MMRAPVHPNAFLILAIVAAIGAVLPALGAEAKPHAGDLAIRLSTGEAGRQEQSVMIFALKVLTEGLQSRPGVRVELGGAAEPQGKITLAVNPSAADSGQPPVAESYRIHASTDGTIGIVGADAQGMLWGARNFIHYYAADWLNSLSSGEPLDLNVSSAPTIQTRGLWSWQYGCYDPYAYIDRASEWKLNTIIFWNRGVPMDAERLNAYAHERGVRLWWGFSWGWISEDF